MPRSMPERTTGVRIANVDGAYPPLEGRTERSDTGGVSFGAESSQTILRASKPFQQTERSFMAQVIRYAELMGWRAYHTFDSRRSAAGFPDCVFVRRPRCVFIETKAERGRLTDDQRAWLAELRACGQEVYLFRPSDWREVEEVLKR